MKRLSLFLISSLIITSSLFGDVLKSNLTGVGVQSWSPGVDIISFSAYKSGGWAYLTANTSSGSQDILKVNPEKAAVQAFDPGAGYSIYKLEAYKSGGWVYLKAYSHSGGGEGPSQDIFKSSREKIGCQTCDCGSGNAILGFTASKSAGWVHLGIVCGPLAVELVSFDAVGGDGYVFIEWETASEMNFLGFNLKRSTEQDGEYKQINPSFIYGKGNAVEGAEYSYIDTLVTNGITYWYKSEALDMSGGSEFFGPDSATPKATEAVESGIRELRVYPNPFTQKTVISYRLPTSKNSRLRGEPLTPHALQIYDLSGRLIRTFHINPCNLDKSVKSVSWDGKDDNGKKVEAGLYFLYLRKADGNQVRKLIKIW